MNKAIKRAAVISGSPKPGGGSTSMWLCDIAEEIIRGDSIGVKRIDARATLDRHETVQDYEAMLGSEALVIIFPLYIFCLPGVLIKFLQDYAHYVFSHRADAKGPAVYAVVNCGFPEPDINVEAVRVIKSFAEKIGGDFRFGVMIGSGGMLQNAQNAPFMKKTMTDVRSAFQAMKDALISGKPAPAKDISMRPKFPRHLYYMMGNMGWTAQARKHGLKKKDLYRRPYC